MNRLLLLLLSVAMIIPVAARDFKYTHEGQTLTYTVLDEDAKTCETKQGDTQTPGNNIVGELTIPSVVSDGTSDFTVTQIGLYAFKNCTTLTSVTIPNTVKNIEPEAFCYCTNLSKVDTSESIEKIGDWAFYGCSSLTSITLSPKLTVITSKSFCKSGLKSIVIPDGVTTIMPTAFFDCPELSSVTIGKNVTTIEWESFKECSALTSIVIPANVKTIMIDAFKGCESLKTVTFEDSEEAIDCTSAFKMSPVETVYVGRNFEGRQAFYEVNSLKTLTIGGNATVINERSYANHSNLTTLFLGGQIKEIGEGAFEYSYLEKIDYDTDDPVEASKDVFSFSVKQNAILTLAPGGRAKALQRLPWKDFKHIEERGSAGIEESLAGSDSHAGVEVYNLGGVKVADSTDALPSGLYIVRQGDKMSKIAVK